MPRRKTSTAMIRFFDMMTLFLPDDCCGDQCETVRRPPACVASQISRNRRSSFKPGRWLFSG